MYIDVIVNNRTYIDVTVNRGVINVEGSGGGFNDSTLINLTEDADNPFSNPYTLPVIPRIVQLLKPSGEVINTANIVINQTTGNISINVGTSYTNAIINTIGW